MSRERALKAVMIIVGLLFLATTYPLILTLWHWKQSEDVAAMMLSLYVTLGVFLLIGAATHRQIAA